MKFQLSPEIIEMLRTLKTQLPQLQRKKAENRETLRIARRCTGKTRKGAACRAWSVWGDADKRCFRHGGAETAAIPRSKRRPACTCAAYKFPHRHASGLCGSPNEPLREHPTRQGQRKYYKRIRKTERNRWLKELGL